ncbi:hypothetical protein HK100_002551 [Physocladia obscura]|uniref:C2H2-type domain-containing protein n=1 Tax=Physocladia obscura TaxID=109957 RepID=A0AAD5SXD0_9FUNG|nr:hypothetical protein HK100_002551 [Physocladia obscura]
MTTTTCEDLQVPLSPMTYMIMPATGIDDYYFSGDLDHGLDCESPSPINDYRASPPTSEFASETTISDFEDTRSESSCTLSGALDLLAFACELSTQPPSPQPPPTQPQPVSMKQHSAITPETTLLPYNFSCKTSSLRWESFHESYNESSTFMYVPATATDTQLPAMLSKLYIYPSVSTAHSCVSDSNKYDWDPITTTTTNISDGATQNYYHAPTSKTRQQHCYTNRSTPYFYSSTAACISSSGGRYRSQGGGHIEQQEYHPQAAFVCGYCRASFMRSKDLSRHVTSVHDRNEMFACPGCPNARCFSRKDALMRHVRTYKCCDLGI